MPGLMAGQMYCRLHRTVTSAGTCPSCGSDEGDPAARAAKYPGITVVYDDPYDVNSPREDAHAPVRTILVIKDGA